MNNLFLLFFQVMLNNSGSLFSVASSLGMTAFKVNSNSDFITQIKKIFGDDVQVELTFFNNPMYVGGPLMVRSGSIGTAILNILAAGELYQFIISTNIYYSEGKECHGYRVQWISHPMKDHFIFGLDSNNANEITSEQRGLVHYLREVYDEMNS